MIVGGRLGQTAHTFFRPSPNVGLTEPSPLLLPSPLAFPPSTTNFEQSTLFLPTPPLTPPPRFKPSLPPNPHAFQVLRSDCFVVVVRRVSQKDCVAKLCLQTHSKSIHSQRKAPPQTTPHPAACAPRFSLLHIISLHIHLLLCSSSLS